MKRVSVFHLALAAVFAALICIATVLVRIPIPATGGYANLGDGMILICAFLTHPLCAAAAAGLGSAMADVLAGYASYAPATLVIKAGLTLIAAQIFRGFGQKRGAAGQLGAMALAGALAEAFMVLGYLFYEAVILGAGAGALGGVPGNIGQAAAGTVIACVAAPVLRRSKELQQLLRRR